MKTLSIKDYEITLLTKGEYLEHKDVIPRINGWWWLRSLLEAYDYYAGVVSGDGQLDIGSVAHDSDVGARPALKFKSDIWPLPIGDQFIFLGNRWTVIDEGFAISNDVISIRRYDPKSSVWETSEIKAWLEQWAKEGEE